MAKTRKPKSERFAAARAPGLPDRETLLRHIRETGETDRSELARTFGLKGADRRALREMLGELQAEGTLSRRGRKGVAETGALPPVGVVDVVERDKGIDVFAVEFNSSSVDFKVRWWAGSTPRNMWESKDKVIRAIKRALDDAGIEIPFPYITHTFKERVPLGRDPGAAVDPDYDSVDLVGDPKVGGERDVTLDETMMPAHVHGVTDPNHKHTVPGLVNVGNASGTAGPTELLTNDGLLKNIETTEDPTGVTVDSTGGGLSHENRPPWRALYMVMKL